ncbi:hypothetical protein HK096_004109, partial [Nowakowskiella sp. JEL0078]
MRKFWGCEKNFDKMSGSHWLRFSYLPTKLTANLRLSPDTSNFISFRSYAKPAQKHSIPNYWDDMKDYSEVPFNENHLPIESYSYLTASNTVKLTNPPVCSRMLVRDFVHDSLYNPNYGYFSKQAPTNEIPFNSIKDEYSFMNYIGNLYIENETEPEAIAKEITRQVWHTPTELFQPWYGKAIGKYIASEYRKDDRGNKELAIYEIGGGNGTLMINILDYLRDNESDLYSKTFYNMVEISPQLASKQLQNVSKSTGGKGKHQNIKIINQSILDWNRSVPDSCFFIAMEVVDNLAHDLVRYDSFTKEPRQGIVLTNEVYDFSEAYEPLSDPLITKFLELRSQIGYKSPLATHTLASRIRNMLPFGTNLTKAEFLPTMFLKLFEQLNTHFPKHRLILSDFYKLPDSVDGINAPVVQTRFQGSMIACSTYLVQPGWFDIFFPTDFETMLKIYSLVCEEKGNVVTQNHFLKKWADLEKTRTISGENPILTFYSN